MIMQSVDLQFILEHTCSISLALSSIVINFRQPYFFQNRTLKKIQSSLLISYKKLPPKVDKTKKLHVELKVHISSELFIQLTRISHFSRNFVTISFFKKVKKTLQKCKYHEFCATHNTIHVKDWIKDAFHCSLLATSICASFIPRLANTDDIDRPIYGLSAQVTQSAP